MWGNLYSRFVLIPLKLLRFAIPAIRFLLAIEKATTWWSPFTAQHGANYFCGV